MILLIEKSSRIMWYATSIVFPNLNMRSRGVFLSVFWGFYLRHICTIGTYFQVLVMMYRTSVGFSRASGHQSGTQNAFLMWFCVRNLFSRWDGKKVPRAIRIEMPPKWKAGTTKPWGIWMAGMTTFKYGDEQGSIELTYMELMRHRHG